jgi:hypothetical protein
LKRLVYLWLVCAAAGFAVAVAAALVLSATLDHAMLAPKAPAAMEMRPIPPRQPSSAARDLGHDRLTAG